MCGTRQQLPLTAFHDTLQTSSTLATQHEAATKKTVLEGLRHFSRLLRALITNNPPNKRNTTPACPPSRHEERKEMFRGALLRGCALRFSGQPRGPRLRESQKTRLRQHEKQGALSLILVFIVGTRRTIHLIPSGAAGRSSSSRRVPRAARMVCA